MFKAQETSAFSPSQLVNVRAELEYERRRVERTLTDEARSAEHDEILSAIRRLDEGTYGICMVCGQPIPYERLSVVPTTEHCIGRHA